MKRGWAAAGGYLLSAILLALASVTPSLGQGGIETAGDVLQLALPATAAGLTLGFQDLQGTTQLAAASALALGVTYGLKYTVNEERPNGGSHSFPSGHSSMSFSSAEFLRKRYGWKFGIPAYLAASFVAYSRVQAKQHYVHDVLAGAAIGAGSSYLFTRPYRGWQVALDGDGRYLGVRLTRLW